MIDFHSHILPGVDDGSDSVEMSVAMLQMEAEQGIEHVVATPHFYAHRHRPEKFLSDRDRAEEALRRELQKYPNLPRLSIGAEVFYFHGMSESEFLPQLTIQGTSSIMIEMGRAPWPDAAYRELERIYQQWGITPVIAHVDRYVSPFRTHGILKRLEQMPVLVQANTSFFLKPSTACMAINGLRKGQIQLLGSDCHDLHNRKPDMADAIKVIERRLGIDAITYIREHSSQALQQIQKL